PKPTPSSSPPCSSPDAYPAPGLTEMSSSSAHPSIREAECSLTHSRPCQRSPRKLPHLSSRKSDRRLFALVGRMDHSIVWAQILPLCRSAAGPCRRAHLSRDRLAQEDWCPLSSKYHRLALPGRPGKPAPPS